MFRALLFYYMGRLPRRGMNMYTPTENKFEESKMSIRGSNKLTTREIARVAHNVNKAYCEAMNDSSQVDWEQAPDWQQRSAIEGAIFHQDNPEATPEDSHNSWLIAKQDSGWKYGPVKDPAKLEHPNCVPYDQLPLDQRAKDYIFRAIVQALT